MKTNKKWKILAILVLCITIILPIAFVAGRNRKTGKVLHLSDLHYDPIYEGNALNTRKCACNLVKTENNCTANDNVLYGRVGCDAPLALIESALADSKRNLPNPDFIVLTGDIVRHHSDMLGGALPGRLVSVFQTISDLIAKYFTLTTIVGQSFGNDDFQKNYFFNVSKKCDQPLLKAVLPILQRMMPPLTHDSKTNFNCGGFYSFSVTSKLSIVVINTILYSVRHNPLIPNQADSYDPMGQFAWLESTLKTMQSNGNSVWIVGHIAPGYESFDMQAMWGNGYAVQYINVIKKYNEIVKAQLFGHEHLNTYRLFEDDTGISTPIIISSSISPIFCNSPQYRIIEYDTFTFEILDFVSYGTNVGSAKWVERFRFAKEFNVPNLSNEALRKLTNKMRNDKELLERYRMLKADNEEMPYPECGTSGRRPPDVNKEICAIEHIEASLYEKCLVVKADANNR